MNETARFLLSAALGIGVALAMLAACRTDRHPRGLAHAFLWLCSLVALCNLLGVVGVTLDAPPGVAFHRRVLAALAPIQPGIVGAGVGMAIAGALALIGPATRPWPGLALSSAVTTGLARYVALAFFAFEIGKATHDDQMREFFIASGYPVAFMYAVMTAEILGALGLLFARSRPVAAGGLALLMVGAIGTHWRNGDPFADSLDALRMLLALLSIAALSIAATRFRRKTQGEPLRVQTAT